MEFRELRMDEIPEAVRLWVEVFGVEAPFFETLLAGGDPAEDVSLGAFHSDGRLLSSVHVFMRRIRDREGRPLKVGGIGSVSTHSDFRHQGLSGRLIEMAIAAMSREGCVWSYLGTGVNGHYARYGWRTVSTASVVASLDGLAETPSDHVRERSIVDETLTEMAQIYAAFTAARPMAHVREPRTWQTAIRYRLKEPILCLPGAYLAGQRGEQSWTVVDLAHVDGDLEVLRQLVLAFALRARTAGAKELRFEVPVNAEILRPFSSHRPQEHLHMMARPVEDRISWAELAALLADPRGLHCSLDNF
jgi:predicted N-acetyltransferase YhbS